MDISSETPEILRSFLTYHESIKGHSAKTVQEYFLDLRTFFRFIQRERGRVPADTDFNEISIADVDLTLIRSITLSDVYQFLDYLSRERPKTKSPETDYGLNAASRARKVATIRSFFKYLTVKAKLLEENPLRDLDSPKARRTLPRYLSLDESVALLDAVKGEFSQRDYCILTLFLNCGLRISELIGLNLSDIRSDQLRVIGKGNKERIVYLNDACTAALRDYLSARKTPKPGAKSALFISRNGNRISRTAVHSLVKKHLYRSGLDSSQYSSHKLRHTAATLMLQNGVDVRTLQEVLGHDHLNTTQIYTHVESTELQVAAKANPLSKVKRTK